MIYIYFVNGDYEDKRCSWYKVDSNLLTVHWDGDGHADYAHTDHFTLANVKSFKTTAPCKN